MFKIISIYQTDDQNLICEIIVSVHCVVSLTNNRHSLK